MSWWLGLWCFPTLLILILSFHSEQVRLEPALQNHNVVISKHHQLSLHSYHGGDICTFNRSRSLLKSWLGKGVYCSVECTPLGPLSLADMHRAVSTYCLSVSSVTAKQADFLKSVKEYGSKSFPSLEEGIAAVECMEGKVTPILHASTGSIAITEGFKLEGSPGQHMIQTPASVMSGFPRSYLVISPTDSYRQNTKSWSRPGGWTRWWWWYLG